MRSILLSTLLAGVVSGLGPKNLSPPKYVHPASHPVEGIFNQVNNQSSKCVPYCAGIFDQLIDHDDPRLGTFPQRYWVTDQYWKGPGSPVVFFTPGEVAAPEYTGYLTNETITGVFAESFGGAVVLMEHRYWGTSSPTDDLKTENMKYLTLHQAVKDNTYFARNVRFPFDLSGTSSANKAPWVFSGGSYSGALSAWTYSLDPGTFWAYHASSAVVETISNFWEYYDPIQRGMPKNCSADVEKVIDYIDDVLMRGSESEKRELKAKFGMEGVEHDDDFVDVLTLGPSSWQEDSFTSGYSAFFQWCDYVENAVPGVFAEPREPGPEGVGLHAALEGYALWSKTLLVPGYCESYGYFSGEYNVECMDSYNPHNPIFTDTSLNNTADRQWEWMLCNEPFEYWQDGAPYGRPTIVSRLVTAEYNTRQCGLYFPTEHGAKPGIFEGASTAQTNYETKGWYFTHTERLIWTNGQFDPWRDSTVSSQFRPGGPLVSTKEVPVQVIPGGVHCTDLIVSSGAANPGTQEVIDNEVRIMKGWVEEYYADRQHY